MPAKYDFPNLPTVATTPTYENVIKALQAPAATESQFLPELEALLGRQSESIIPDFETQLSKALAGLSGQFQRRRLTGSSIEAHAMSEAVGQSQAGLSQALGQQAGTFAQLVARARAGDVAAQRQMLQALAMAMGEEFGALRDISLFREQQGFLGSEAAAERTSRERGSFINLGARLLPHIIKAVVAAKTGGASGSGSYFPGLGG